MEEMIITMHQQIENRDFENASKTSKYAFENLSQQKGQEAACNIIIE